MWAGHLRHKHTQMRGEDIHRRTWYPRRDVGVRLLPQRGCVGNKDMARPQIPIVKGTRSIISILLIYKRVAWYGVYYGVYYGVHFLTNKQRRAGTNILILTRARGAQCFDIAAPGGGKNAINWPPATATVPHGSIPPKEPAIFPIHLGCSPSSR